MINGLRIAGAGLLAVVISASPVLPAQVTLETTDGSLSLTGELLEFDGTIYRIETLIGSLEIDAASVSCIGDGCPDIDAKTEFAVAVGDGISDMLLANLMEEFAFEEDLLAEQMVSEGKTAIELTREVDEKVMMSVAPTRSNTPAALQKLQDGITAVAVTARRVTDAEISAFTQAGLPDPSAPEQEKVIALDALVPIASADSRLRSVTILQLAQILSGQIRNWSQLGGENLPIRLILPEEDSASSEVIKTLILDPNRVRVARTAERMATDEDIADAVARDSAAFGVVSLSARRNAQVVPIRRICGPVARATEFSVKAEEYPLTRRVYMYMSGGSVPSRVKDVVDFAGSSAARDAIQSVGFIDQSITPTPIDQAGGRLAAALISAPDAATFRQLQAFSSDFVDALRLSTTFRFETGSSQLDNKAIGDIDRMAEYLTRGDAADQEVLVVGFTDSFGRQDLNLLLGESRAEVVRDQLIAASGGGIAEDRITVLSYGPLAPIGCNETPAGRTINRRVEVWLRDRG